MIPDHEIMKFFSYAHLPERLQGVSKMFHDLAINILLNTPSGAEQTVALRKLLESKDCAVRSLL